MKVVEAVLRNPRAGIGESIIAARFSIMGINNHVSPNADGNLK